MTDERFEPGGNNRSFEVGMVIFLVGRTNGSNETKQGAIWSSRYVRELGEVRHLDLSHASQDLHQVKAFVRLQPTDEEEEEEEVKHNTSKTSCIWFNYLENNISEHDHKDLDFLLSVFFKTQLFAGRSPSTECIHFTLCKINNRLTRLQSSFFPHAETSAFSAHPQHHAFNLLVNAPF